MKIGDRVKLIDATKFEYPDHKNEIGTIVATVNPVDSNPNRFHWEVKWMNGSSYVNHYNLKLMNCTQCELLLKIVQ